MNVWSRIKRLSLRQLIQLGLLFASRPLLIVPTIKASKRTMIVCDSLFGKSHHGNNRANAFRHAFWNVLICQKTLKWTKNQKKSMIWAEKVTFLYEKVTQNENLAKMMDLHNNGIGRILFSSIFDQNEEEIIENLTILMKNAQKIVKIEEFPIFNNQLVYLSEK